MTDEAPELANPDDTDALGLDVIISLTIEEKKHSIRHILPAGFPERLVDSEGIVRVVGARLATEVYAAFTRHFDVEPTPKES